MNLWTGDRWNREGVNKDKDERNEEEDENVGWDSKMNHLVHPNVEFVRVQWRKTGVGEWISAWDIDWNSWEVEDQSVEKTFRNFFEKYPYDKTEESRRKQAQALFKLDVGDADLQCATSRGEGCSLKWNLVRQYFLSGLNDGSYEVRAKVFCSGYDSFATSEVRGSVTDEPLSLEIDVTAPTAISTHVLGRTFSVAHTEPVRCPQLQSHSSMPYKITRVQDCEGYAVQNGEVEEVHIYSYYSFICMTDSPYSLAVNFPDESQAPDGTYEITVNANAGAPSAEKVADYGGNAVKRQVFRITIGEHCKQSSELGFSRERLKRKSDHIQPKMSIRSLVARLGFAENLDSEDESIITMKRSTIARVLFATVSVTAGLVYYTMRRLHSHFGASRAGDVNEESQESASLLHEKHLLDYTTRRESSYGSVI